jgi:hypothetical protein
LNELISLGCKVQRVDELGLDPEFAKENHAEVYSHIPAYIVIGATKA